MKIYYCYECKELWVYYKKRFSIIRLYSGKKAKIKSRKCFRCIFFSGDFFYQDFLDYLTKNNWSLESNVVPGKKPKYNSKIKATYNLNPELFYILPYYKRQTDFTYRLKQMITKLEIMNPGVNIIDEIVNYIFSRKLLRKIK